VANEEYATQIARDWNTRDEASGFVGYVLRFRVSAAYLSRYPLRVAGAAIHQEYWIPSEELDDFNKQINGVIETVSRFPAVAVS
jgi:hypothetical protein